MDASRITDYIRAAQIVTGPPGTCWIALERGPLDAFLFILILVAWGFLVQVLDATAKVVTKHIRRL